MASPLHTCASRELRRPCHPYGKALFSIPSSLCLPLREIETQPALPASRTPRMSRISSPGRTCTHSAHRLVGAACQQSQQAPLSLEQPPQHPSDCEGHVPVRHRRDDLLPKPLPEERRTFRLAARAEVACLAAEGKQVLPLAGAAADPGYAVDQPPAIQVGPHGPRHNAVQRTAPSLETLLVTRYAGIEMLLEWPVEHRPLGMGLAPRGARPAGERFG